jgi:hypothetical protein
VNSDRSMETGRISFVAIDRWAARYGLDATEDFDRLCTLIYAMDAEYGERLSHMRDGKGTAYMVDADDVSGIQGILSRINQRYEAMHGLDSGEEP